MTALSETKKYQAYPEYKDSGVEWLEEVPSDWDVIKIKHLSPVKRGASPRPIDDPKYFDKEGEYAWVRIADVSASKTYLETTTQTMSELGSSLSVKLEPNQLFLSIAGTVGKPCINKIKACIHDGFVYFPDLKIPNKYLFYVFAGEQAYKGLGKMGTQLNLNTDTVGDIKVALPREHGHIEQIVHFLDHETAKIDTLIEKQQQLIKLLKEKRQAVISHAVTKGLNPQAPMKNSGVEWLGEVPEHWKVCQIKHTCQLLKDGTHLPPPRVDEGIPLLSVRNIIDGKFGFRSDDSMISERDYTLLCKSFIPQKDDVLLAIVGATLGKAAIVGDMDNFHIQRSLGIFRTDTSKLIPEMLLYIFTSRGFQNLLWEYVGFSAQPGIYLGTLANFSIPIPTIDDQKQIISYCKKQTSKLDELISKADAMVLMLQERRTALISAAVTGKFDVRNWQAPTHQDQALEQTA